ncbi:MAG TPA: hypothetical protein VFI53_20855 [Myxococcaceae bacterium]|nr:hypothetical protein [Myxococcaceae bacterium]
MTEEVDPDHVLHREEDPVLFDQELVERDKVVVPQVCESAELPLQPIDELRPRCGNGLERDVGAGGEIPREVHDTESTGAESADRPEAPRAEWIPPERGGRTGLLLFVRRESRCHPPSAEPHLRLLRRSPQANRCLAGLASGAKPGFRGDSVA